MSTVPKMYIFKSISNNQKTNRQENKQAVGRQKGKQTDGRTDGQISLNRPRKLLQIICYTSWINCLFL